MTVFDSVTTPYPAKLLAEDFLLLDRAGAFSAYSKTELIDGTIYVVNAQYSEHFKAKVRLLRRLADACDALGTGLEAWSEGTIALSASSMPEPDVFVTCKTPMSGPVDKDTVILVVEVADTTQAFDLGEKSLAYARGGVPEYWVLDLKARIVHRRWAPGPDGYGQDYVTLFGERIEASTITGLAIETDGLE
ncbi:MAG: Uma2 family endonuclease [Novosphingobium sp.]